MSEEQYKKILHEEYSKSPKLLSRVIARALVWNVGQPDHRLVVEQLVADINRMVEKDKIMKLCDDFARLILDAAGSNKNN